MASVCSRSKADYSEGVVRAEPLAIAAGGKAEILYELVGHVGSLR